MKSQRLKVETFASNNTKRTLDFHCQYIKLETCTPMITKEKTLNPYPDTKIPDHPKGEKSIKNKNWKKEKREIEEKNSKKKMKKKTNLGKRKRMRKQRKTTGNEKWDWKIERVKRFVEC